MNTDEEETKEEEREDAGMDDTPAPNSNVAVADTRLDGVSESAIEENKQEEWEEREEAQAFLDRRYDSLRLRRLKTEGLETSMRNLNEKTKPSEFGADYFTYGFFESGLDAITPTPMFAMWRENILPLRNGSAHKFQDQYSNGLGWESVAQQIKAGKFLRLTDRRVADGDWFRNNPIAKSRVRYEFFELKSDPKEQFPIPKVLEDRRRGLNTFNTNFFESPRKSASKKLGSFTPRKPTPKRGDKQLGISFLPKLGKRKRPLDDTPRSFDQSVRQPAARKRKISTFVSTALTQ